MNLPKYQLESERQFQTYTFTSMGPKGPIKKEIQFEYLGNGDIYNLGFGDQNPITGEVDDMAISNNDDRDKVLATVVKAVLTFLTHYPKAEVLAVGSTPSRTRLYRIGINHYFEEISTHLEVYGLLEGNWQPFEKGLLFEAFLVKNKSVN